MYFTMYCVVFPSQKKMYKHKDIQNTHTQRPFVDFHKPVKLLPKIPTARLARYP